MQAEETADEAVTQEADEAVMQMTEPDAEDVVKVAETDMAQKKEADAETAKEATKAEEETDAQKNVRVPEEAIVITSLQRAAFLTENRNVYPRNRRLAK